MRKLCLRLAGMCLAVLCGCAAPPGLLRPAMQESVPVPTPAPEPVLQALRLAYSPEDALNPYRLGSELNRALSPLIYDAPVRLSPSFQPEKRLAEWVEQSGATWTVRLRGGITFSDGRPLTAQDAAYSLGLCRGDVRYRNVLSAEARDESTLVVTLARPDIYFENLLTFPVIPLGTGDDPAPPGAGRYNRVIHSGDAPALLRNDAYPLEQGTIERIALTGIENVQEIGYKLMSGQLDLALLEPDSSPMETAGSFPVPASDMLYLGFNATLSPGDEPAFRRAVGLLLDRYALVTAAYGGRADAASLPVHPAFYPQDIPAPDAEAAGALLDALGFSQRSAEGFRLREGREIDLQLALNMESSAKREAGALIKRQLEAGGLRVTLNDYTFEQYLAQVASGGYSMYLGETRLPEDMDITALLSPGGALHHFLGDTAALYDTYLAARQGQIGYGEFLSAFAEEQPFVPLLFDQAVIAHSRNFYSTVVATQQDIFYNIHKW